MPVGLFTCVTNYILLLSKPIFEIFLYLCHSELLTCVSYTLFIYKPKETDFLKMYRIFCVNKPKTCIVFLENQRLFAELQSNLNVKQSINDYFNSFFERTETYFRLLKDIKNHLIKYWREHELLKKLRQTSCLTGLIELVEDQGCLLMVDTYESHKKKVYFK